MAQLGSLPTQIKTMNQVSRLLEAFRAFDADNDGLISAAELGGIMGSLGYGINEEEVNTMMQQGDQNGDGLLSLEEFLEINTKGMELGDLSALLENAIKALDVDENQVITGDVLYEVLQEIGDELSPDHCQDIIASIDGDGDGIVSFEDLQLIINSLL